MRVFLFQAREPDRRQSLVDALSYLGGLEAEVFQGKSNLVFDRRGRELYLRVLKDDAHRAREGADRMGKRIQASYSDSAVQLSTKELRDNPRQSQTQRGFARAGRS